MVYREGLGIGAFACEYGELERSYETLAGLDVMRAEKKIALSLSALGCATFAQMTGRLEDAIKRCVAKTLDKAAVRAADVNHILFATSDNHLFNIHDDFTREILLDLELSNAVPTLLSMRQCVSSLAALDLAHRLLDDPDAVNAVVVAFDIVSSDADRLQSFALFGDAVASCLVSRGVPGLVVLESHRGGVDRDGLRGQDNFESRKRIASAVLSAALAAAGIGVDAVEACFTTNFFKPITLFNANICGIPSRRLAVPTLQRRAHCGNCDWMMNLAEYADNPGLVPGAKYLALAFAPGFAACAVLTARGK